VERAYLEAFNMIERLHRQFAVDEAVVCAQSAGHTEPKANTEFCVSFLMDRFPELGRSDALSAFMRLCLEKLTGLPDGAAGYTSPRSVAPRAEKTLPTTDDRQRRRSQAASKSPLGARGEPMPIWSRPLHSLALNRRYTKRSRTTRNQR
jgi:hypothetical protein